MEVSHSIKYIPKGRCFDRDQIETGTFGVTDYNLCSIRKQPRTKGTAAIAAIIPKSSRTVQNLSMKNNINRFGRGTFPAAINGEEIQSNVATKPAPLKKDCVASILSKFSKM